MPNYSEILWGIEERCRKNDLNHRIVGGTITDLLGSKTNISFDFENNKVLLSRTRKPEIKRTDGTNRDVDLVCFQPKPEVVEETKKEIKSWLDRVSQQGGEVPYVSIEPTNYPDWPKWAVWRQMVNRFVVNKDGKLTLNFRDRITQQIKWKSVEPWSLETDDVGLTMFNPIAHALCYRLRSPSGVKSKDTTVVYDGNGGHSKISLIDNLANKFKLDRKYTGNRNQKDYYSEWQEYIDRMANNKCFEVMAVAFITRTFWNTGIGEAVSHGRGPLKTISTLSDRMRG